MWIVVTLVSYSLLAFAAVVDKHLLRGPLPNPKVYAFYVGLFGALPFVLIPWFLEIPPLWIIVLAWIAGLTEIIALYILFTAFHKFEVSRIVPAVGGIVPIVTAALTLLLTANRELLQQENLFAFILLVAGTVIITLERKTSITLQSLLYAFLAASFFSVFFVFSKFVFESQPFLSGIIWLSFGYVFGPFIFLATKEVRDEIKSHFLKKPQEGRGSGKGRKTVIVFLGNQIMGGSGGLLQNLAVFLAPFGLLAFVNALAGVQYLVLFVTTAFLSAKSPNVLKENITKTVLTQKFIAIFLIGAGLAILALV